MLIVVKPHDKEYSVDELKEKYKSVYSIFLAGTIDNGNSEDWQTEYIKNMEIMNKQLSNDFCLIIYNPRRDSGKGFDVNNEEEMNYQVNWELDYMDKADSIFMNLLPNSKSPISLMEIGLYSHTEKLRVVCPKEFYRYNNVKIVCDRYSIPFKETIEDDWTIQP